MFTPVTMQPYRSAAHFASLPQPQPISSRRCPGERSSLSGWGEALLDMITRNAEVPRFCQDALFILVGIKLGMDMEMLRIAGEDGARLR